MHVAMKRVAMKRNAMKAGSSLRGALTGALLLAATPAVSGETAYITQASSGPSGSMTSSMPLMQTVPVSPYGPRQAAFAPTPETAATARNGNIAQTLQIGSYNTVFQSQSGGNNVSNVGILGGKGNNVGVWQGGGDLSNVNLINTQGLNIAVLQPPGATPVNMLIAKLPNGALLIKR